MVHERRVFAMIASAHFIAFVKLLLAGVHLSLTVAINEERNEVAHSQPKDHGIVHDELSQILSRAVIDLQRRQGELDCLYGRLRQVGQYNEGNGMKKHGWAKGSVVSSNGAFCAFADSAKGYLDYRRRFFFQNFAQVLTTWLHPVCDGQCVVAKLGASSGLYGAY